MSQPLSTAWEDAAQALSGVLQAENAALRNNDFKAAIACLPAKRAAIAALESLAAETAPPGLAATLRRLESLTAENRILLNRAMSVQSQVLGIIAHAARTAAAFGYGSYGQSASRGGNFMLSARA